MQLSVAAHLVAATLLAWVATETAVIQAVPINPHPIHAADQGSYQGDIRLTAEQAAALQGTSRTALRDLIWRWPNATVPVHITNDLTATEAESVKRGMRVIEAVSCVRFRPRTFADRDFVQVWGHRSGGCWSMIGRIGGAQQLNLQPDNCLEEHTIVHEFLHALGFFHMQAAFLRDLHVTVQWDNIWRNMLHNFARLDEEEADDFGLAYDVGSLLHYGAWEFSRNGLPTIVPRNISLLHTIGRATKMSDLDIKRLNLMYCQDAVE